MRAATAKFRSCFYWFPKKSNACGGAQEGLSGRIGVESLLFSGVPALFLPGSAVAAARRTSNSEATVPHRDHHRVSSRTRGVTDHRCFVFREAQSCRMPSLEMDDGDSDADGVAMVCCITRIPALRS